MTNDKWHAIRKRVDDLSCQDDYLHPWKFQDMVSDLVLACHALIAQADNPYSANLEEQVAGVRKALEPFSAK